MENTFIISPVYVQMRDNKAEQLQFRTRSKSFFLYNNYPWKVILNGDYIYAKILKCCGKLVEQILIHIGFV